MLPYDGEPLQAPSTSAWQWDARYSLYFNPDTQQWAKPRPDGGWDYAAGTAQTNPDATRNSSRGDSGDVLASVPESRAVRDPDQVSTSRTASSRRLQVEYDDVDEGAASVPENQRWPGSDGTDEPDHNAADPFAKAPLLRLIVHKRPPPSVLPPAQSVASLDPSEPVSIGRDKSFERRIRLRELAVSKTHCTLFWALDPQVDDGGYWAVVDNASTHGTYVSSDRGDREIRLSEPKVASVPTRLHHLDTIRAGSTTFQVHIHPAFACTDCSVASDSSNLIPLITTPSDATSTPAAPAYTGTKTKEQKEQERREQMAVLRGKLLKPPGPPAPVGAASAERGERGTSGAGSATETTQPGSGHARPSSKASFVDRAAARRHRDQGAEPSRARPLTASASAAASGASSFTPSTAGAIGATGLPVFFTVPGGSTAAACAAAAPPAPPDPFASDSRGAQLLSKLSGARPVAESPSRGAASTTAAGAAGGGGTTTLGGLGTLIEARTYGVGGRGGASTAVDGAGEAARPGLGSRPLLVGVEKVSAAAAAGFGPGGANGDKRDWRDEGKQRSWKRLKEY